MGKKVIGSLIVLGLLVCGVWLVGAKSLEQGAKGKTESKINANSSKSGQSVSKPKIQQVGTPTVQQLLDRVKGNYGKITDLKADWKSKIFEIRDDVFADWLIRLGGLVQGQLILDALSTQNEKFFFKSPDKLKWILPKEILTTIYKNNVEYVRRGEGWGSEITKNSPIVPSKLPWYTLLDPDRFDFYWRLDEIITKFDSRVISHPETDVWVIEAVPKGGNPEDDYNYPVTGWLKYEFAVDFNKGVFTKIIAIGIKSGNESSTGELSNFEFINNVWIPTKLTKTVYSTEEYTLSNIQINTGIPDSEFEF